MHARAHQRHGIVTRQKNRGRVQVALPVAVAGIGPHELVGADEVGERDRFNRQRGLDLGQTAIVRFMHRIRR